MGDQSLESGWQNKLTGKT